MEGPARPVIPDAPTQQSRQALLLLLRGRHLYPFSTPFAALEADGVRQVYCPFVMSSAGRFLSRLVSVAVRIDDAAGPHPSMGPHRSVSGFDANCGCIRSLGAAACAVLKTSLGVLVSWHFLGDGLHVDLQ